MRSKDEREQERAARIRLRHMLEILEGHVTAVRSHVEADLPTTGVRRGLVEAVVATSEYLAIIDAFRVDREKNGGDER